jgi:hypothetical protein
VGGVGATDQRKLAQISIRWAYLGVRQRLLDLAQQRGVDLGISFLATT